MLSHVEPRLRVMKKFKGEREEILLGKMSTLYQSGSWARDVSSRDCPLLNSFFSSTELFLQI